MALPTIVELKAILRIQTTAEDTLLTALLARALGTVQSLLGRPIVAVARTWTERGARVRAWSALTSLAVPNGFTPFDPATLAITDADGDALVLDTDYLVPGQWDAVIPAVFGLAFSNPPYLLTADVGLSISTDPDYATLIEPVIGAAMLDIAADLYQRRSPAATSESTGGGVSTSYASGECIQRVKGMLSGFTVVRVV